MFGLSSCLLLEFFPVFLLSFLLLVSDRVAVITMLARPQTTPINLPLVAFIALLFCSVAGSSNSTVDVTSTTEPTVSTPPRTSTSTLAVTRSTPDGQTVPAPAVTLDTQNATSASLHQLAIWFSAAMKSFSAWGEIPPSTALQAAYNACMRNYSTNQISSPQPGADATSTLATVFPVTNNASGNGTTPSTIADASSTSKSKRKPRTGATVARGSTKMGSTVQPSTTTNDIVPRILAAHEARMREKDERDFGIRVGLGTTATVALLVLFVLAVYRCKIRRRCQSQKTGQGGYSSVCYDNSVFRKSGGSDDFLMEDMTQPSGFQNVTLL